MLFDSYVMVDWSGANAPRTGKDSIWVAILSSRQNRLRLAHLKNLSTRCEATLWLGNRLAALANRGDRILTGFDFPFGFPDGTTQALGLSGLPWRQMWQLLSDKIEDDQHNRNSRFDVAEYLNQRLTGEAFPFWGNVREEDRRYLLRRGRRPHKPMDLAEQRIVDQRAPGAQPVWKLAGVGSVGSQTLTGIPKVWALRRDPRLAFRTQIWPFETGLNYSAAGQIIFAEVYPSLFPVKEMQGKPKDAAQVLAVVKFLAALDQRGTLESLFRGDIALSKTEKTVVEREEAWILGVSGAFEK